jgi:hypothetical protein
MPKSSDSCRHYDLEDAIPQGSLTTGSRLRRRFSHEHKIPTTEVKYDSVRNRGESLSGVGIEMKSRNQAQHKHQITQVGNSEHEDKSGGSPNGIAGMGECPAPIPEKAVYQAYQITDSIRRDIGEREEVLACIDGAEADRGIEGTDQEKAKYITKLGATMRSEERIAKSAFLSRFF